MKKNIKIVLSFIFLFSVSLMFFACTNKPEKKILQTPSYIGYVNNGQLSEEEITDSSERPFINNQFLLVTEKNLNSYGYRFYVTDSDDYENRANYTTYETVGYNNNYCDITEIFDSKKTYHFYVQYIGKGKYIDSECSEIACYEPQAEKIKNAYATLSSEKICWTRVLNATKYEIYEQILDSENNEIQSLTKIAEVNYDVEEYDFSARIIGENSPYYKYQYAVKALAGDSKFYLDADLSNKVEYKKEITLNKVTGVKVNKQKNSSTNEDEFILSWNAVKYATKYEVKINLNDAIIVEENNLDITSYITNYTSYNITVKAVESDALKYNAGDYSNNYTYDNVTKLNAPSNLSAITQGENIIISFDADSSSVNGYTIEIYYNGERKEYNEQVFNTENQNIISYSVNTESIVGTITKQVEITIKIKANAVGQYIYASDFATLNYNVEPMQ